MVAAMNDVSDKILEHLVSALYADISKEDEFERVQPTLAHYTSLISLEKILTSGEL